MRRAALIAVLSAVPVLTGCGGGSNGGGKAAQDFATAPIAVSSFSGMPGISRVNGDGCCFKKVMTTPSGSRDSFPTWSPDGKTIAFNRESRLKLALYVVDGSGGEARRVPGVNAEGYGLSWSPDGKQILFVRRDGLWTVTPSGEDARLLVRSKGASSPSWSPDGKSIAFVGFDSGAHVFLADADGARIHRLTKARFPNVEYSPSWSPDGKQLAYVERNLLGNLDVRAPIKVVAPDGSGSRTLTTLAREAADVATPTWSPDGKRIAFWTTRGEKEGVFAIPREGGAPQLVLEGRHGQPNWGTSPS